MIRIIVAVDQKLGISKKGFQPWYIPEDELYFSRHTKLYGGNVLVGSTTFRTFQGSLADRTNYVATRHKEPVDGATIINDIKSFLEQANNQDIWVIGGAEVFEQALRSGMVDELYITHIEADFNCDKFFPSYSDSFTHRQQSNVQAQNGFKFSYAIYDRLLPAKAT